jgi:fucose 4-O-acetylase-like acetyltransferase
MRLVEFDIAKAICIVLVVIGHYIPEQSPEWYVGVHDVIYSFHMPLFMFASGYIYNATRKDGAYGTFLWKKVKRLMVPYVVTSFIVITIKLLTQGNAYVQNPVTSMAYLQVLWSPVAGYFLWFIWALWWMFVVAPLFKTKGSRLALLGIAVLLHYVPITLPDVFCLPEFKRMLMFFALGMTCMDYREHITFNRWRWTGAAVFISANCLRYSGIANGGVLRIVNIAAIRHRDDYATVVLVAD